MKRLNLIAEQLAGLDFDVAPGYLVNGLKREQLIATNSMILHELFFDGLGEESEPDARLAATLARDFGSYERWRSEFLAIGNWRLPRPALLAEMAQDQIAQDDEAEDGDGGSGPDIEANQRVAG